MAPVADHPNATGNQWATEVELDVLEGGGVTPLLTSMQPRAVARASHTTYCCMASRLEVDSSGGRSKCVLLARRQRINPNNAELNVLEAQAYISVKRTCLCKVTSDILHGVVSPEKGGEVTPLLTSMQPRAVARASHTTYCWMVSHSPAVL